MCRVWCRVRPRLVLAASGAALSLVVSSAGTGWAFTAADSFAPDRFDGASSQITNRYLPMEPGTRITYDGVVTEDGESKGHRVVTTITGITKLVDGVRTRVILDQDYDEDELAEQEIALFAQDTSGVVWSLGEYPEEYEGGKFTGAPSTWLTGREGARAGIAMQADPATGTPEYVQGFAPKIEFDDRGKVLLSFRQVSDALGTYTDALVVDERSATEPDDGHQLKFHAPGRGVVRIEAVGGAKQETLKRTSFHTLSPAELAAVNAKVVELDGRAYANAADAWSGSTPAAGAPSGSAGPTPSCLVLPATRTFLREGC